MKGFFFYIIIQVSPKHLVPSIKFLLLLLPIPVLVEGSRYPVELEEVHASWRRHHRYRNKQKRW